MKNRISAWQEDSGQRDQRNDGPQPIGEILAELLAQYQIRFPEARIAVVETPAAA
jgi:hypothetical protein